MMMMTMGGHGGMDDGMMTGVLYSGVGGGGLAPVDHT